MVHLDRSQELKEIMRLPTLLFALAFALATPALAPAMAQAPKPVDPAALAQAKIVFEKSGSAAIGQQMASRWPVPS